MRTFVKCFAAAQSIAAAVVLCSSAAAAEEKFTGVPRDIDYIKNLGWSQVIVQGVGSEHLIAQTKNERILSVLLVALSLKSEALVRHIEDGTNPRKLTSAALEIVADNEEGHVRALSFAEADGTCRAVIIDNGKKEEVWTKSASMQGILETAVRQSLPIQEFTFDEKTKEITRGKVNVTLKE